MYWQALQHLQVLRDAGLLAVSQQGTRRLYEIRPEGLDLLEAFLTDLWPTHLRRLRDTIDADRGS